MIKSRRAIAKQSKQLIGTPPIAGIFIVTATVLLSLVDILGYNSNFASFAKSPIFIFFHEIRFFLAIGIVLFAAYYYNSRLAVIAAAGFILTYIPYFIVQFPSSSINILRTSGNVAVAIIGIWLIARLRASEKRLKVTVENSQIGVALVAADTTFLSANKEYCRILGYSEAELRKMTFKDITHLDDLEYSLALAVEIEAGRTPIIRAEKRYLNKDGNTIYGYITASALYDRKGRPSSYIVELQDITGRKTSEERYKTIVQTSIDGFWILDEKGHFLEVNDAYCRLVGYSRDDLLTMEIADIEAKEKPEQTAKRIEKIIKSETDHFETQHRHRSGHVIDVDVSVTYLSGNQDQFFVTIRDMTEHKKAEKALLQSEENFRRSADESPLGIRVIDIDGETLCANNAFLNLYGYQNIEEFKAVPAEKRYTPHSYLEHVTRRERRKSGEYVPSNYEVGIVNKEGEIRHCEVYRKEVLWDGVLRYQVLYNDITKLRLTQEQLIAQDRLASIGQLVSGVSHELNNPLTSVLGFSELLLAKDLPNDIKEDLKIINGEARRTALIVKNLLTFARQQPQEKQEVDINETINTVLQLRSHEQNVKNIKVNSIFAPNLPRVLGNMSQLQQVFLNIIINAEYAMIEAHKKGLLVIQTNQVDNFIKATFSDSGPGISKQNMVRLFSPFFTTKEVGKGTGLGLSISQGIITEHGGKIWAESGNGATFTVQIPVYEPDKRNSS